MPAWGGAFRFAVAGAVMAGIAAIADRRHGWPSRRQWAEYSVIGVLLLAVGNGLVMWSEKRIPSSIAALIVASVPVWLTLFDGFRAAGQRWTVRVWTGTLIGLLGVVLVARPEGGIDPGHWSSILALQAATLAGRGTLTRVGPRRRLVRRGARELAGGGAVACRPACAGPLALRGARRDAGSGSPT